MAGFSIRRTLVISVISLSLLVILIVSGVIFIFSASALRSQGISILGEHNQAVANMLDSRVQTAVFATRSLASTIHYPDASPVLSLWSLANSTLASADTLIYRVNVWMPFEDGSRIVSFRRPSVQNNSAPVANRFLSSLPQDAWFLQALESDEIIWRGPYEGYNSPSQSSMVSAALRCGGGTNNFPCVIWVDILQEELNASFGQILMGDYQRGSRFLINQDGVALTAFDDALSQTLYQQAADSTNFTAVIQATGENNNGLLEMEHPFATDEQTIVVWSSMPQTGWRFISLLPGNQLENPIERNISKMLVVVVVGVVALGGVIYYVANRYLTIPLNSLANAAQEIGSGDMRYQISYQNRQDEIGRLARVLEDMKRNLAQSYRELSLWSHVLERRVTERTEQLEAARREAQTVAAELRVVYDASLSIVQDYQLEALLQTLTERINSLFQASYSAVWLLTTDEKHLSLVATTSPDKSYINMLVKVDEGLIGQVVRERRPIILDEYQNWPGRLQHQAHSQLSQVMCVPLIFFGKPIGALVAGRDEATPVFSENDQRLLVLLANLVSPVVRNAQLYVQREAAVKEAERASSVKTRFLASVTHELRTPLNLIINNMDFMRVGAFGPISQDQGVRLDQTIRSAEHLLYLINDLLDVSKIEAGEMQLFIQPTEIYPIIEDALDSTMVLVEGNPKITLSAELPDNLPTVPIDARRVRQVLTNLLSNAVKFTPEGEVRLIVRLLNDSLEFEVRDTGIGIPQDEMDKLFEAFERTKRAKQMGIEGTGLGLPISRYLVEAHGGHMRVNTEIGKGSSFIFTIPLNQPDCADGDGKEVTAILAYR